MKLKLISVPSSQGSLEKNLGCKKFPELIFEEPEFRETEKTKIKVIQNDIEATDELVFEEAKKIFQEQKLIEEKTKKNNSKIQKKKFPLFLGGDHSITYSEFKAFAEQYENACLIVFDAHADCAQFFKPVSHEDMNKTLVEEGILKKENLLLIGVRKIYEIEEKWLKEKEIQVISSNEVHENLEKTKKQIKEFIQNKKNIFLSIDCDAFDPSIMPATGYLEKNGLNEKEFFELLGLILENGKVKGMDLVEINPLKDEERKGFNLGKGIIYFIGGKLCQKEEEK
ncbi:MAG: arginase family protein [Candidatus Diapherotrites archaeon]